MKRPVVVGVDGSPSSLVAAEHAAMAASQRECPLHLVHGYLHPLGYGIPIDPYAMALPGPPEDAAKMLQRLAVDLGERWPTVSIEIRQIPGGPGASLVEESEGAELVVVGSRGFGGFTGLLLGSVSTQVASHAHCPVLVVHPAGAPVDLAGPVVVGVDGSEPSQLAVAYAADEAARRGSELVLVHVYAADEYLTTGMPAPDSGVSQRYEELTAAHREQADDLLARAAAVVRQRHPKLRVQRRSLTGMSPKQVLLELSGEASLLVVGTRGHGGFAGLLLGSVSQAVVQHARCPVLVARTTGH